MSAFAVVVQLEVGNDTGDAAVQRIVSAFEHASDEISDFGKHVFPRFVPVFEAAEKRQFDAEGEGPYAGHWAALSAKYAEWKQKAAPGQPTLVLSGDLREALTQSSSPLAARDYSASQFNFGTVNVPYASFHQLGTAFMPARPPFDFDGQFEDELERETHLGIVDAVRAGGVDFFAEVTP